LKPVVKSVPVPRAQCHEATGLNKSAKHPPSRTGYSWAQGPDFVEPLPPFHVRTIVLFFETDDDQPSSAKSADYFFTFPVGELTRRNAIQQIDQIWLDIQFPPCV